MPFVLHDPHADKIIEMLRMHSKGVTLGQIQTQFSPPLPRRTAQRLVTNLVALGAVTATGGTRYRAYHLRTKPGLFGMVQWIHPDSQAAAAVALPEPPKVGRGLRSAPKRNAPTEVTAPAEPAPKSAGKPAATEAATPPVAAAVVPPAATTAGLPSTATIAAGRVQPLLDSVLPKLLSGRITPDHVLYEAQMPAISVFVLKSGETPEDAATLITAALDRLTVEQAVQYGIDRASFARWRELYWPTGYALQRRTPAAPLPPLSLPKSVPPERVAALLGPVQYIVTKLMKPTDLRGYLETQKIWLRGEETPEDWQAVLTAELNRLRLEDALQRKIRPEQYRLWRKECWPAI